MDLESGTSLWPKQNKKLNSCPPLNENISCDVLIVGGGIVGALLAYRLSKLSGKEKVSVVLIEKDEIGKGSTIASTALLIYSLDVSLIDLIEMIGKEKAIRVYKLSRDSVLEIEKIIEELGMDCCYKKKKTLYLASNKRAVKDLRKEYSALKENGFNVDYLEKDELKEKFSLKKEAGIILHEGAEVDPYKLTQELLKQARLNGVRIYEHTEAALREKDDKNCEKEVLTTAGYRIKTQKLIFATGYESKKYIDDKIVDLKSSYVIASSPLPSLSSHWLLNYLVWETSRPYLYIRTTSDNRIIVGGEDKEIVDATKRDKLIPKKSKKLKNKFEKLVKDVPIELSYAWAGTFGETNDGLGYVGIPKDFENIYFVLGFGGNGITFSVIATDMLKDMLLGKEPKNKDLFTFDRLK